MTTLVLDAGALIALHRNDRSVWAMLRNAADDSAEVSVPAGVIAQAWRDRSRQALLARALAHWTRSRSTDRSRGPLGCCADRPAPLTSSTRPWRQSQPPVREAAPSPWSHPTPTTSGTC